MSEGKIGKNDARQLHALLLSLDTILAILPEQREEELSPALREKIEQRERARREKDFEKADQIRDELLGEGIILEDTPEGVRWKYKG
jgi:cysteinyl-tRNA synthetase